MKQQGFISPELGKKMTLIMTVVTLIGAMFLVMGFLDNSESVSGAAIAKPQCGDQKDNDGDGYCDYLTRKTKCLDGSIPGDADCASATDNKEATDCEPVPERCDGYDNNCNSQIDEGLPVSCSSSSSCGTSGWTGTTYCGADGNVYKDYISYQCNYPGMCSSSCSSQTTGYVYESCSNGCENGACKANETYDYQLTVNPTTGNTVVGGSASSSVDVTLVSGTPQVVSLYTSGCPQSATCSFSTGNKLPSYSSVLTVTTQGADVNGTGTPPGTYPITVIGYSGSLQRSAVYTLIVS